MAFQEQQVKEYFSKSGTVSQWWDPESNFHKYHFDTEKKIIEELLPIDPAWRVLDVGCGQGRYTIWFAQKGCSVTGVDISSEMLELCRKNAVSAEVADRVELVLSDVMDLSQIEDGQYDIVSCMGTFVHLTDLESATRKMLEKLRKNGHFLYTFASSESLHGRLVSSYFSRGRLKRLLGSERDFSQVARPLDIRDTVRMLERCGLVNTRLFGIGLLFLFLRPEFRDKLFLRIVRRVNIVEERIKPFYSGRWISRFCATIIGFSSFSE
jgi:ubiquinone/menaquinone biosynthesis C-methylase UbiE